MRYCEFCLKPIPTRSKYAEAAVRRCHKSKGHEGRCGEFPYLSHLKRVAPRVESKIKRDATMTTGAAWPTSEAGPNRILRWVMLLDDSELLTKYEIDMSKMKPQVVAKLREKKAPYENCMAVAIKLTWLVYQMENAPEPPMEIKEYLQAFQGPMRPGSTFCIVCRLPLSFDLFTSARRGTSPIETCHHDPRLHTPENVGFAHRECNIAQGQKSLDEFYAWIEGILRRVMNYSSTPGS